MERNNLITFLQEKIVDAKLDAYLIPNTDVHQNEYVAFENRTVERLTGFSGSAATLVLTKNSCSLWTDSRYFIQAQKQLEGSCVKFEKLTIPYAPQYVDCLLNMLSENAVVGVDGRFWSLRAIEMMKNTLSQKNIIVDTSTDLVSPLLTNNSPVKITPAFVHGVEFSGVYCSDKIIQVRKILQQFRADALIVSSLADIAWMLNIRGNDIEYNPFVTAFSIVFVDRTLLFVDKTKIENILEYFNQNNIEIIDYDDFYDYLNFLTSEFKIIIDSQTVNYRTFEAVAKHTIIRTDNFIESLRAIKNEVEISGIKNAHKKDGLAMKNFLSFISENSKFGDLTEISVVEKLLELRQEQELFVQPSFSTIAAYNENGAIVHYTPTPQTDAKISGNGLLLIDSGGQYLDGTTDLTRTIAIGKPTNQQKTHYTIVLKGLIALSNLIFPEGTCGRQIDVLARMHLWKHGLNYGHGTGHGVGMFACVHEGPQRISPIGNQVALKPGMLISIEPGIYIENEYGIRLENLVLVKHHSKTEHGVFMCFETLTQCPFDEKLIMKKLLTKEEQQWLVNANA